MKKKILYICFALSVLLSIISCDIPNNSDHTHIFNVEKISDTYLAQEKVCGQKAKYYYSCSICGISGSETFESDEVVQHISSIEYDYDTNNHWNKCSVCGENINHEAHKYVETSSNGNIVNYICECGVSESKTCYTVTVNYLYSDGSVALESFVGKYELGTTYDIQSPIIDNVSPSIENVSGTINEDTEITVTYDYNNSVSDDILKGQKINTPIVDFEKGLSISYVISGSTSDWDQIFRGDKWAIHNGNVRIFDDMPCKIYQYDWYDSKNSVNGASWNELLTFPDEEILVTWSFNADKSISVYKNGVKVFHFASNKASNWHWTKSGINHNYEISDLWYLFMLDAKTKGYVKIGYFQDETTNVAQWEMHSLNVGYAMEELEASEYAAQYKIVNIKYVNESKQSIWYNETKLLPIGYELNKDALCIPGYTAQIPSQTCVITGESDDIEFVYTRNGNEHFKDESTLDRTLLGGWDNVATWLNLATNLTGDFVVTAEYVVNSTAVKGNLWRTTIGIVYDTYNVNNRITSRLDWEGWQNGALADNFDKGLMWCGSEEEYISVSADCTIRSIYSRVGDDMIIFNVITANSGEYEGNVYYFQTEITGISKNNISLAIVPEYASVTVKSVYY